MCGRVVATQPRDVLAERFGVADVVGPELPAGFNVAPGATLYAVAAGVQGGKRLGTMRWGLVPPWATSPDEGPRPINARAETVLEKAVFADSLEHGRTCVIPVDGFYEWSDGPDGKQPFLLSTPDGSPLALAGLWSRWSGNGAAEPVVTFTIVTAEANDDVAPLHDRMPVVLSPEGWATWLDRDVRDVGARMALLMPALAGTLTRRAVSRRVNDARNDDPELLHA